MTKPSSPGAFPLCLKALLSSRRRVSAFFYGIKANGSSTPRPLVLKLGQGPHNAYGGYR
jgi:hypothetical protein